MILSFSLPIHYIRETYDLIFSSDYHSFSSFVDHFVIQAHSEQASTVDFNDQYLITGSEGCTVGVWSMDVEPGKNLHLLEGHKQGITEVKILYAQDTRPMCVSGSYDGSVRIWSVKTGLCLAVLLGM